MPFSHLGPLPRGLFFEWSHGCWHDARTHTGLGLLPDSVILHRNIDEDVTPMARSSEQSLLQKGPRAFLAPCPPSPGAFFCLNIGPVRGVRGKPHTALRSKSSNRRRATDCSPRIPDKQKPGLAGLLSSLLEKGIKPFTHLGTLPREPFPLHPPDSWQLLPISPNHVKQLLIVTLTNPIVLIKPRYGMSDSPI